jgi:anti-sigma B factor antagonist
MTIKIDKKGDVRHLSIDDEMTIYSAAALKEELLGHLENSKELEISLENVSEMDSAGLQLMLVLRLEASRIGKELHFVKHSPAVIDVLETLNLAAHLGDPIVLPAGGH